MILKEKNAFDQGPCGRDTGLIAKVKRQNAKVFSYRLLHFAF
jgi:hypothetical protein